MNFSQIRETIVEGYTWLMTQISELFGIGIITTNIIFWLIIIYLILFLVIIPIHKKLKKQRLKKEQEIVQDVDEMIYLLAKAQHTMGIDVRKLGGNPNIALMKSIFTQGHCDYIQSTYLILDNIHKVETLLGNKIISLDKESLLLKDAQKYRRLKGIEKIFLWIATVPTLGIYYLIGA